MDTRVDGPCDDCGMSAACRCYENVPCEECGLTKDQCSCANIAQLSAVIGRTLPRDETMAIDQDGLLERFGPDTYHDMEVTSAVMKLTGLLVDAPDVLTELYRIKECFSAEDLATIVEQACNRADQPTICEVCGFNHSPACNSGDPFFDRPIPV